MIGVGVRQREHRELAAFELTQDPAAVPSPAGVDQHVADQVDVDYRSGALRQPPHAVCQPLHHRPPIELNNTLTYPYSSVFIRCRIIWAMAIARTTHKKTRLSREDWIGAALEA